jgi:Secretion system C-terminal sorting domain
VLHSIRLKNILFSFLLIYICSSITVCAQCIDCGNGIINVGETNLNCPQDISHDATCVNPCAQPTSFESTAGIRISLDFVGTTTWSTAGLPVGWAFAGAPTPTTSGGLPAADAYGAKAGLIQPNCSGSCAATNGFCIGNLANNQAVGAGGASGKLGANFDGRANVAANLSYAVLRGQNNPTLVSPTYNMSAVEGFKIQFWLFPSETSCGQSNSWGSCVGNVAFLDFSSNGGTSWTQVLQMDLNSSNTDMCTNNSTNTKWLTESSWSRVCVTVFKTTTSPGNFYPSATGTTAASGIMMNSAYFTANFKYRIRYSQTASCTSGITTTNPGRYLAIDYPVITSGNEMIPCGISFANMCGYGADNNDDGVGSLSTTNTFVFGTVRRSENQAERGVEILTSQTAVYGSQNLTGSNFATNFDLCNAEGGDKQCLDWRSNNNFYTTVYECIADWEAASGTGINVQYYKGTTPQSTGMSKVTSVGKTALIGWRYSANRIVSCGAVSDLNPGCNGYSFLSGSLPIQFSRGFYHLATNGAGQAWTFYGATSCSHYFNGPFFSPISIPDTITGASNYITCIGNDPVFTGLVNYCFNSAGFSGTAQLTVTGPNGFLETFSSGANGTTPIVDSGDYYITAILPGTPAQCLNCARSVCIQLTGADLVICDPLPIELISFEAKRIEDQVEIIWTSSVEINNDYYTLERSVDGIHFNELATIEGAGNSNTLKSYMYTDEEAIHNTLYYRLKQTDYNGATEYLKTIVVAANYQFNVYPNPNNGNFQIELETDATNVMVYNIYGQKVWEQKTLSRGIYTIQIPLKESGIFWLNMETNNVTQRQKILVIR